MRSKEEIRGIVDGSVKSGMTRRTYCEKHNIGISTLDYWRPAQKGKPKLVEVAPGIKQHSGSLARRSYVPGSSSAPATVNVTANTGQSSVSISVSPNAVAEAAANSTG
jgi:hypothetical protein